ncbi:5188_t:CDS:10 [Ambispora leptoticha]|uniref:5188_t:CDS:1 n=1 Tax=Ambispora leptoticha TaxID=144679 RepID=A0A9N9F0M0_9GLOM|nr:5188_t:CDS:10 [Ambispora leptoticha]
MEAADADMQAQVRRERRRELRNENLTAWSLGKPDPTKFKNLDSNIKKNTGFIKKCKTQLSAEYQAQLLKDINTLTLEKYISEVVAAVVEGVQRCKMAADIWAAVEVISALHQRFPDTFTPFLTHTLARSLVPPNKQQLAVLTTEQREKEENTRIAKQRVLLRIAGELWLMGVLRNVEDGIAALNSGGAAVGAGSVNGVKDNVAGFVSNNSIVKDTREVKEYKSSGEGFLYTVMKELLSHDSKHLNLPLAVSFVKNFGPEIIGTMRKQKRDESVATTEAATTSESADMDKAPTDDVAVNNVIESEDKKETKDTIVTPEHQTLFKNLLVDYFHGVESHLLKDHEKIKRLDHSNHEYYITRGEIPDETKQNYEKVVKAFEKFLQNAQTLADALDLEMIDLPDDAGTTKISSLVVREGTSVNEKEDIVSSIWEDEDARSFYETLIDLKTLVPGVLLEAKSSKKDDLELDKDEVAGSGDTEKDDDGKSLNEDPNKIDDNSLDHRRASVSTDGGQKEEITGSDNGADGVVKDDENEDVATKDAAEPNNNKSGTSAQLDSLLSRLPNLVNRDLIDQAAVDFCYLNSKAARKKLLKTLVGVPRTRLDLLPYYARLIATLNPHYPDITAAVLQARKKTLDLLETKVKNIRFLSELTKFRITPQHLIFHCLKVVLDDFSNQNIDIACNLLETCGRFLFKSPETSVRMGNMLDIMMRKKSVQHLDSRQLLMVENAYYQCNPPDHTAIVLKERSIMEQYIRKLIYTDLNKKTVEKVLKLLRKLNWEDKEVYKILEKCFSKVWKIKYSNIHLMAILVSGLHRYHSDFGVALVDRVLEDIRIGLEQNIFKHNQRRIATVKYLGELYNYRMVDSPVIFDTLYTIVTLGHEFGRPNPSRISFLDAPNDFFRVRLCCTLLDTCGVCFDRGTAKKRLDDFLVFFQMYILSKHPLPMDVEFMVSDIFELLRPSMIRYKTYEEAAEEVDQRLILNQKAVQTSEEVAKNQEEALEESDAASSSSEEDDDEFRDEMEREPGEEEEDDEDAETDVLESHDHEEEEVIVHTNRQDKVSTSEDEDFEREFSKMMTESLESRKYERKPAMLDVAIPMHLKGTERSSEFVDGNVSFTLLTKKGNKQQMKTMEVPADSALAVNTRSKQEAEREEQAQLKKLVLNYEEREEQNQRVALEQSLISSGMRVSYQTGNRRQSQRGKKLMQSQGGGGGGNAGYSFANDRRK